MNFGQRALQFSCQGSSLVGIIDVPDRPLSRGVLVITGAPQYRVGSHRHFTGLARMLAARGIPVMRFDHRGVGDSEGEARGFDALDEDIRAAMKEFFIQMPEMKEIVIWGLGDGATSAALFAQGDTRVTGVVLLNPWVQEAATAARAALFPHLLARFGELGFWKRVASGGRDAAASAAALRQNMRSAAHDRSLPLAQRVIASLACFDGAALVILGGDDPEARQFGELLDKHESRCKRVTIAGANHTFASRAWRDEVAETSANWLVSW